MNTHEHKEMGINGGMTGTTRRELLKFVGRYGALLGLLGGVGTLAARTACDKTPCGKCPLVARCELPKAQETRAGGRADGRRS